ncbi:MAG TPA: NAD-dependent epimerase/dehydratase family protein [Caulobacteraceae bacterium]|nr:NAD-dependent epimerase/dehydratase family protein [Caulobacteraceae bacterium]
MTTHAPTLAAPVLVLGATSLIGRFMLPLLEGLGVQTFALSRKAPVAPAGAVHWVQGSLDDPQLEARLPEAATVFSLSPIWILPAALPALKARGMVRLVAFSSTSLFTKAESDDEGERRTARKLADGEAAIIAFCQAHGVAWTILRPTMIYAEGQDQNVSRLARLIGRFGFLPLAGQGEGLRQPVHAQDLAAGALEAAVRPAARDKAYDLSGGETLTYRQMAERIFQALGRPVRIVSPPLWLWRLGFALARSFLPGATAQMGRRMNVDLVFKSTEAENDLEWRPRPFQPNFSRS